MLNRVVIAGRLTKDPELRRTSSGTAVTSFTVAVERDFPGKNDEKEVDFIECVAWRVTAEFIAKYFTKGSAIMVDGRLQQRHFQDRTGTNRSVLEVVVDNCYFGDRKKDNKKEDR